MAKSYGRYVLGLAAIAFAAIAFVWRDFNPWQQIRVLGNPPYREVLLYAAALVQLGGGALVFGRRTARAGATVLASVYLVFALLWVPEIAARPQVYDPWGNFFEQFSVFSGALVLIGMHGAVDLVSRRIARIGYFCFGICVISFTLEQAIYLSGTANFVPKWIPPGQMFWAIATTVALGLAAIALLSGRAALPASRWLTAMLTGFGLLVWLPAPFADPHKLINWAGNAQNLAITGAAWIVADYLGGIRRQAAKLAR